MIYGIARPLGTTFAASNVYLQFIVTDATTKRRAFFATAPSKLMGTDSMGQPALYDFSAAQVNSDWNASTGIAQILNKPTLGTAAAQDTSAFDASGAASTAQATAISAAATDATTKANAAQAASQPLDADLTAVAALTTTSFGRSLLTMADGPTIRAAIGAGTSSFSGAFGALTGVPTTLSGYGITDAYPLSGNPSAFITTAGARTAITLTTTGTGAATYSSSTGVLNVPTPTSGTVTSVGLTGFNGITVSGSPISTSGTIALSTSLNGLMAGTGSAFTTATISAPIVFSSNTLSVLAATTGAAGTLSASDKTKLDGIAAGATANTGTVTNITLTQPSAGFTVSNSGVSQTSTASFTFTLSNDLASLEALSGTGIIPYRSGSDSWSTTTVSAPLNFTAPTLSITAATSGAAGSMSAADKAKLDAMTLFGGVNGRSIIKVTNTYTSTVADDIIFADTTTVAFTVTLPSPSAIFSANRGKPITVICIGAKTLTVMPPGGTINGVAKDTVTAKYSGANYYSDGTNFFTE